MTNAVSPRASQKTMLADGRQEQRRAPIGGFCWVCLFVRFRGRTARAKCFLHILRFIYNKYMCAVQSVEANDKYVMGV